MAEDSQARFDTGAQAWANYNQKPMGRIRREVTWHNLLPHLPAITNAADPPRILDAGGGSGELALQLVQRGYRVWLLDYAHAMLDQAQQAAQALPDDVRARLTCHLAPVDDAGLSFAPGFFDAIACHTLIEYLPDPCSTLGRLAGLLRGGGLLSVAFVNRHAGVLRHIWSYGDPAGALANMEGGSFCANLFGLSGMAYGAEEIGAWLAGMGLTVTATCGVRAFADYIPRDRLDDPEFFAALLRLELAAATRAPYCQVARYTHILAHKNLERTH